MLSGRGMQNALRASRNQSRRPSTGSCVIRRETRNGLRTNRTKGGGASRVKDLEFFSIDVYHPFKPVQEIPFRNHSIARHSGIQISSEAAFPKTSDAVRTKIKNLQRGGGLAESRNPVREGEGIRRPHMGIAPPCYRRGLFPSNACR